MKTWSPWCEADKAELIERKAPWKTSNLVTASKSSHTVNIHKSGPSNNNYLIDVFDEVSFWRKLFAIVNVTATKCNDSLEIILFSIWCFWIETTLWRTHFRTFGAEKMLLANKDHKSNAVDFFVHGAKIWLKSRSTLRQLIQATF